MFLFMCLILWTLRTIGVLSIDYLILSLYISSCLYKFYSKDSEVLNGRKIDLYYINSLKEIGILKNYQELLYLFQPYAD